MTLVIVLVIVALGALGIIIYLIGSKFSQVSNVNISSVPGVQQVSIKRQILEDKLRKNMTKRWESLLDFFSARNSIKLRGFIQTVLQKLKELEQEYRVRAKRDLSSRVKKSKNLESFLKDARISIKEEKYNKAEQVLMDALRFDEHNIEAYSLLANVYWSKGEHDKAKETYEFILRLTNNKDPNVMVDLGNLARERGDLSGAVAYYRKAVLLDAGNFVYSLSLAQIYILMSDYTSAQEAAKKALLNSPNNPKILDFLIENSIVLQDKDRALDYLGRLREVNPENGKISTWLKKIDALS